MSKQSFKHIDWVKERDRIANNPSFKLAREVGVLFAIQGVPYGYTFKNVCAAAQAQLEDEFNDAINKVINELD